MYTLSRNTLCNRSRTIARSHRGSSTCCTPRSSGWWAWRHSRFGGYSPAHCICISPTSHSRLWSYLSLQGGSNMVAYLLAVGQALLALALAPGLVGFVRWLKARLQNRRGAPPWQPYFELRKLFGKEVVMSNNASWLFRFAPYMVFGSAVAVTLLIPLLFAPLPFDSVGDLLVVVYLLLLGTFFLALAGLDPGTAFGG